MSARHSILVVDDDTAHRTMLRTLVGGWGYEIAEADDGEAAIRLVRERAYDLVLMDVRMLKVSGLEALAAVKTINPAIPVVIMTAFSSVETAVAALTQGAHDYLTKPLDFDKLRVTLERSMEHTRLKAENRALRAELAGRFERSRIVGRSPAMLRLLDTVAQVAPSEATVLISGESGTGKELVAGALHVNSARRDGPFVSLNCAAIPESLMESELFGHEKGAFTGAERRRDGPLRAGRRRHAVPRRGGRHAAVHAGQAAARLAGAGVHARGRRRACCASTCAWSRRPTRTCPTGSRPAASARTSTTASTWCASGCRRCASGARTSRCSPSTSWRCSPRRTARP